MTRAIIGSLCLSALILSQALAPAPARAQAATGWSLAGAGCVPTGQTASGVGTSNSAGDLKFPTGKAGEIIATCPVASSIVHADRIGMTYRDPDGSGPGAQVKVALRQKNLETGAVRDVPFALLDSNSFAPAGSNRAVSFQFANQCAQRPFIFRHGEFAYYVQINMNRRSVASDVLLASVTLSTSFC